ncbi:MAG TPA: hypothetical protein VN285_08295 [Candidatus Deferrimicrobium sp.]|nr:hypothetical protein [Candidatus Deferrimicrobium sp.]
MSIRATGGVGYLPLNEWTDFARAGADNYRKERFGAYWDIGIFCSFARRHAVGLTVGGIGITAYDSGSVAPYYSYRTQWDFKTAPVTLVYEFYFSRSNCRFTPFIGAGVSYLITDLEVTHKSIGEPYGLETSVVTGDGEGYGFQGYLGLRSQITPSFFLVSRMRGQYADGWGFTRKKGDVKIEFTGADIALGLECRF